MKFVKNKRLLVVLLDFFLIGFSFFLKPITLFMFRTGLSECIYRKFGLICPGCGGTRCVYFLSTGNFSEAFRYNPGIVCGIIYLLTVVLLLNLHLLFKLNFAKKAIKLLTDYRLIIALIAIFIVFGFSRNFYADFL